MVKKVLILGIILHSSMKVGGMLVQVQLTKDDQIIAFGYENLLQMTGEDFDVASLPYRWVIFRPPHFMSIIEAKHQIYLSLSMNVIEFFQRDSEDGTQKRNQVWILQEVVFVCSESSIVTRHLASCERC